MRLQCVTVLTFKLVILLRAGCKYEKLVFLLKKNNFRENTPYSNVGKAGNQSRYEYPRFIFVCMQQ